MQFLTPIGFWLAALAIPILLLYMLKLRRKQTQVSSIFLWQQVLREQQANSPWQKLKRNLLLILQLLILAALIFALARPAIQARTVASGSVIVLLDASASMNATDVDSSRFELARKSIHSLINGLNPASSLTLILVGKNPEILSSAETDKTKLHSILNNAQVTQGRADWQAAFALAVGATQADASETTIVIVSDGGLPESGLPALPGDIQYLPIGTSDNNLGISALALRATENRPQLFAEVSNYSNTDQDILLSFYFGDELFEARQLTVRANSSESLTLDELQNLPGVYKASITNSQNNQLDPLSLDDTAYAVYQSNTERRVLLVSSGNLFLEQALASLPNIQAFRALPAADGTLKIPADPFDLYVFDGIVPAEIPNGNLLFIDPPSNPFFEVGALFDEIKDIQVNEHPLTRYLDWSNVHILQAHQVQTPEWADALVKTEKGALVFAGETNGQRIAALTFDLRESDLPLQIAFPILFSNLTNYLIPPSAFDATQSLHPADAIQIIPPPGTQQLVIASPSNLAYTLPLDSSKITFNETGQIGFYAVNFLSQESSSVEYFAVNLFDADESNIRPRESIQIGQASITQAASNKISQREVWPWLAVLALILLIVEWQVYHRRQFPLRKMVNVKS